MFEKYIIVPDSLRAASRGETPGFEFDVRIAYYRGLLLSMVEGFELSVDARPYDPAALIFRVGGEDFSFAEMATEADARWEFNEAATLFAPCPEGLSPGLHDISIVEILRISYMAEPARRADAKTLHLAASPIAPPPSPPSPSPPSPSPPPPSSEVRLP